MKVASNKNFVPKSFSESRCEWLCIGDFFFKGIFEEYLNNPFKTKTKKEKNNNGKCNMQSSYEEKAESTELQAFKRENDGYKVTAVIYDSKRWRQVGTPCIFHSR